MKYIQSFPKYFSIQVVPIVGVVTIDRYSINVCFLLCRIRSFSLLLSIAFLYNVFRKYMRNEFKQILRLCIQTSMRILFLKQLKKYTESWSARRSKVF